MEHRHDQFQGWALFLLVNIDGYTTAVVGNGTAAILVKNNLYFIAVAGQGLIHRIVNHFINQMMKTTLTSIADKHGGAFTNGRETLKNRNLIRTVKIPFRI
ncbi:hypothetical protein ES703_08167 [subsurface metagenome]